MAQGAGKGRCQQGAHGAHGVLVQGHGAGAQGCALGKAGAVRHGGAQGIGDGRYGLRGRGGGVLPCQLSMI